MKTSKRRTSSCRYCSNFQHQGRRGGFCSKLGVTVQSEWAACHLAKPVFAANWENFEGIALLEKSFSLNCDRQDEKIDNIIASDLENFVAET